MALPIVETPRYELTLPSQETKVQYRPFLVKEEKILYMALESGDEKEIELESLDSIHLCFDIRFSRWPIDTDEAKEDIICITAYFLAAADSWTALLSWSFVAH